MHLFILNCKCEILSYMQFNTCKCLMDGNILSLICRNITRANLSTMSLQDIERHSQRDLLLLPLLHYHLASIADYELYYIYIYTHIYYSIHMYRFISTFLTKAACCRSIEIVLHPTTISYIYIVVTTKEFSENKVLNIVNVEL